MSIIESEPSIIPTETDPAITLDDGLSQTSDGELQAATGIRVSRDSYMELLRQWVTDPAGVDAAKENTLTQIKKILEP